MQSTNPAALFQQAVQKFERQDWAQAEALCRQVLQQQPGNVDALHMLGLVLSEQGKVDESVANLRAAVDRQPSNAVLWTNLGRAHRRAGQLAEAIFCQRRAIAIRENFPEAYFELSSALGGQKQFDDAIAAARRATELRPNYAEAYYNLGNLQREEGRLKGAVASYRTALTLRPNWASAHLNIAAALIELGEPADAVHHYREVLRLEPTRCDAEFSMGHALMALGKVAEANAAYERAAAAGDAKEYYRDAMSALYRAGRAEVIPPDRAYIDQYRAGVQAAVEAFAAAPGALDVTTLHQHAAVPSMMLAYFGMDVRPIMEDYARAIGPLIPRFPIRPSPGKPKLGIVVTNGHEGVFARCWGGIAERLSRELFDVRIVCSRAGANVLQTMIQVRDDEYLRLPSAVDEAARLIHDAKFSWLHYWEIGTDAMNYYLPFFQAAPGQSACWGWPATSGNPLVNDYLSCEQLEPAGGQRHYSEHLIEFKHLPTYYVRPPAPPPSLDRSHFGIADDEHVYLCTQNLRKYHPDFDLLLADLLRTDPRGRLLIIADAQSSITALLLDRFRRALPDVVDRVRVMPRAERDEYLALVAAADVALDTIHYGSGANTVYDTVAVGTPLVMLPGEFHRSRWAAAVNRRLQLPQLIAGDAREYIATAHQVASNPDLRQTLCQQILSAGAELFEDTNVIREHEEYFSQAVGRAF